MKKPYLLLLLVSMTLFAQPSWHPSTFFTDNPNNQRFDDVFFLNENLGWAANGAYAEVYKTTNGGVTWQSQLAEQTPTLPGNYYFRNIEFLNENIGFLGTLNGAFLKTSNGGTSWEFVTNITPNPVGVCGLDAVGTSTIYGCGAYFTPAFVIKSVDSGATWKYIDMIAYANALVEILFVDENIGYAAGNDDNGGVILKTTDGGQTWTSIYNSNLEGEYVWKLQVLFSNPNFIVGVVESVANHLGKLITSNDNGVNWTEHDAPESIIQAVGFISETRGWVGGHTTGFYETNDGGATWTNTGVGNNLNRIFVLNDQMAYAAGARIYKFSEAHLGSKNFSDPQRQPLKASIEPNPVKDKLSVKIEFTDPDHLNMELYDSSGRMVKMLQKDDINKAGAKIYAFDFPYAKGIYYVSIHTNSGRQAIKFVK